MANLLLKIQMSLVGALVKSKTPEVESFVRYEVGEGIEKKEDNFVEEVMAQAQSLKSNK